MRYEKFKFKTWNDIAGFLEKGHIDLPCSGSSQILFEPVQACRRTFANRVVFQPMESCNSSSDGGVSEAVREKYHAYAAGGAGTIWFETVAITPEGRGRSGQLLLTEGNADSFARCVDDIKETCIRENGYEPVVIMQAAHAGRISRPRGYLEPVIAYHNPNLEVDLPLEEKYVITDEQLKQLEERYVAIADDVRRCGFDGVDVKACHGYLLNELLSAFLRPGKYGGSLENRSRFIRNVMEGIRQTQPEAFIVTTRISVYDALPYPYGFGVKEGKGVEPDISEALEIIGSLVSGAAENQAIVSITMGNPQIAPHVNRPFDRDTYRPHEHPLEGVYRILRLTGEVQRAHPHIKVVGTGLSYLRQFLPLVAAGALQEGFMSFVGIGRGALAYPGMLHDLREHGELDPEKVCLACGRCARALMSEKRVTCIRNSCQQCSELPVP